METYTFGPASGSRPQKIVLMLHGVGSNGQDLIGLAPYLARAVPNAVFLSPNAPEPYDMAPMGYQWFSLRDYSPRAIMQGIQQTAPVLETYIDAVLAQLELKDSDLALLGFSQGTMMSLYTAPRRKNAVAGVLGYSGRLVDTAETLKAIPQRADFPVCLIHGEDDPVLPIANHHTAMKDLAEAGYAVDGLSIPGLPHSIDEAGIERGAAFLQRVLG